MQVIQIIGFIKVSNNKNTREEFPNNMDTSQAKIISMLNRISEGFISI